MICAIQTLLCGDTSSGISAAISTEALKRQCSSSVDIAFKLSDLKPKEDDRGGNDGTGSRSRRCVPVSHLPAHPSAHQQLIAVGQRYRGGRVTFWTVADTRYSPRAVKSCRLGSEILPSCSRSRETAPNSSLSKEESVGDP